MTIIVLAPHLARGQATSPTADENEADGIMAITVYDVRDLLSAPPAGPADPRASATIEHEKSDLEKKIEDEVEPNSWKNKNPNAEGSIDYYNGQLIINQSGHVHDEIADYLAKLRDQRSIEVSITVRIIDFSDDPSPVLGSNLTDKLASAKTVVITLGQMNSLLRAVQRDRSGSIIHAPRITLQNGQSGILREATLRQTVNWMQVGSYIPSDLAKGAQRADVIDGSRFHAKAKKIDLDSATLDVDIAASRLPPQTDPTTQPSAGTLDRLACEVVVPKDKIVLARMTRYFRCAWVENSNQETDWSFPSDKDANEPSSAYCLIQAQRIVDAEAAAHPFPILQIQRQQPATQPAGK